MRLLSLFIVILLSFSLTGMATPAQETPTQANANQITQEELPLPTSELPRMELETELNYTLEIVFMGQNYSELNQSALTDNIPNWYAPVERYPSFWQDGYLFDANYSINYEFTELDSTEVSAFREFLVANAITDLAPGYIDAPEARYIPGGLVERYLVDRYGHSDDPKLFIIDTWSTRSGEFTPYYYNVSSIDLDGYSNPRPYGSQFQISGGGEISRNLWVDISAGPTTYRGQTWKHISEYTNDTIGKEELVLALSDYVRTSIELRFLPSYLYEPIYSQQEIHFDYLLIDLDEVSSLDYWQKLDANKISNDYSALYPHLNWTYSQRTYDWQSNAEFVSVLNSARNDTSRSYDGFEILSYLSNNYDQWFDDSNEEKLVIPIFLFAFPEDYLFSQFLGIANYENEGEFAYVVAALNYLYADEKPDLIYEDWYNNFGNPWTLDGPDASSYVYSLNYEGEYDDFFETTINSDTAINFHLLNQFNFDLWSNEDAYDAVFTASGLTGLNTFNITIDIPNQYYWIIEKPDTGTANVEIDIDQFRDRSFGFTFVAMHEIGHGMGLSHPHDGHSWMLGGEYLDWLWDLSYSQMTYAHHHLSLIHI